MRPKAYRTKRTLGLSPYQEKCIQKIQGAVKGAVKPEGLPDKENPGPETLPGKEHTKHELGEGCKQK